MQTNHQFPMLLPFMELAQANMTLFGSGQALIHPVELMQGMTRNYVAFVAGLNRSVMLAFEGTRVSFVTLAQEL